MSKQRAKNGSRKPFPGDDKVPDCLRGCTTANDVLAKIETLNASALEEAAKVRVANEGVHQAERSLANQLDCLVPVLREMQLILSHKSALHYLFAGLNLPSFTEWAKDFVAKARIEASWSTIKRAMDPNRRSPSLRSEGHIPASKLQTQRVGFAALAGTELAEALERNQDYEDALWRLRATGATKADILALLKRAGAKDVTEFTAPKSTSANDWYSRSDSQFQDSTANRSEVRPGGFSQIENLIDHEVGPASRVAFNVDDPDLQVGGLERIISYWARKFVPFNSNLGQMELSIRFVRKDSPKLRREGAEAIQLEAQAQLPAVRLLSSSQASAETSM